MSDVENEQRCKRPKLQQSITSMFGASEPKFVEVLGVQLACPYCHRKFRAPQGLANHKFMHERARDKVLVPGKGKILPPNSAPQR